MRVSLISTCILLEQTYCWRQSVLQIHISSFNKGHDICHFMFAFLYAWSLLKRIYSGSSSYREQILSFQNKPLLEGRQNYFDTIVAAEDASIVLITKMQKNCIILECCTCTYPSSRTEIPE